MDFFSKITLNSDIFVYYYNGKMSKCNYLKSILRILMKYFFLVTLYEFFWFEEVLTCTNDQDKHLN